MNEPSHHLKIENMIILKCSERSKLFFNKRRAVSLEVGEEPCKNKKKFSLQLIREIRKERCFIDKVESESRREELLGNWS